MKKLLIIFILFTNTAYAYDFNNATYIKNYDGDTVTFNLNCVTEMFCNKMSVRVYGIDTPELRTKNFCEKEKGYVVKDFVFKELINAKKIELKDCIEGKYFRIVCKIIYDGKNLTQEIIKKGFGYPYFGKTKKIIDWCK